MKTSMLWNGFELIKGDISTTAGSIPYLYYSPEITYQPVNIAIHGEGSGKDDWLCFNSTLKLGNLLKESIKNNSPFLAFDLYGHGEWIIDDHHFNISHLSESDRTTLIKKSSKAIQEAIPKILNDEDLTDNPISVTAFSLGCSVALELKLNKTEYKTVLISPYKTLYTSDCKEFLIIRGKNDPLISEADFLSLYQTLPSNTLLKSYRSRHDIPESWINRVKEFIYK